VGEAGDGLGNFKPMAFRIQVESREKNTSRFCIFEGLDLKYRVIEKDGRDLKPL